MSNVVTVLVVDSFPAFRRVVTEILQVYVGIELAGETNDGLDAVRLAASLQPSVVVLGIHLAGQNGFEAAPQIMAVSPASKIIFVSTNHSADLVEEALRLGHAYVDKSKLVAQLLPAIRAVLGIGQYPS